MEYKVVSLNDRKFFSGKLDPQLLQSKINELAATDWRLKAVTSVHWPNWLGWRRLKSAAGGG